MASIDLEQRVAALEAENGIADDGTICSSS